MAKIIDGKAIATNLNGQLQNEVAALSFVPGLAVVLVGDDPASQVYVRGKIKACDKVGIKSFEHRLPANATQDDIAACIDALNADENVNGILLQLPLPQGLNAKPLIQRISPEKDVDGLTHVNMGRLMAGDEGLRPCTPSGCEILLKEEFDSLAGKIAVVIGRSELFGKPMAQILLQNDCTVFQCHSKTKNLASLCKQADIVIAAVGRPEMVKADWVKEGAFVIDVGINRTAAGKLVGDVDFNAVAAKADYITPVPGGVGPMTIAMLLQNTVLAAKRQNQAPKI
ncbi:MAG: bifunctional methylenetetrahydrofolate dehydrogenase/methenyltetrahydrofolate cyclohydrolase FolD [Pseudomonadota bacterium]|nr:bifunctional methylenetetrahydrofolate dehydrogenase/methenyltetrahydrofolate cyclohydrolase FolD [Pseudomonadota bacterium]MEC7702469.1 bifunctional methylenetetrahydrofolate dehydrogenase/methenyltetrahydrofolate cyclohydrolase FolD [Pseudomonadota bacterium]MED5423215.1 bifunctional methylenetetrahydrofolate dehydrogenase/methenyltetrahydrofolate cyclohydrolase FolD [Pseudomonadota bacterium]